MNAVDLAGRLGLRKLQRDWRGACPACGYSAFAIRAGRNGTACWSCWGCQDREAVAAAIRQAVGGNWTPPTSVPRSQESADRQVKDRIRRAVAVWDRAGPALGSPVANYLFGRGLPELAASTALRFAPKTSHPQGGPGWPALVARIVDVVGETTGVHRTYLQPNGAGKASVEPQKASLGIVWGCAIRLQPHDPARPLVIGEGIETAASAGLLAGLPAWSEASAGNLGGGLILPPDVRDIIIAADPDEPGEQRAIQAAWRWQREGRRVRIARTGIAGDWNDMLRDHGRG